MIPAMVIWTITLKVESNTLVGPKYQRGFDYGHDLPKATKDWWEWNVTVCFIRSAARRA